MSFTNEANLCSGTQTNLFFAFEKSPINKSTSTGQKYEESTDKTYLPILT
jgi:hypothetical protein